MSSARKRPRITLPGVATTPFRLHNAIMHSSRYTRALPAILAVVVLALPSTAAARVFPGTVAGVSISKPGKPAAKKAAKAKGKEKAKAGAKIKAKRTKGALAAAAARSSIRRDGSPAASSAGPAPAKPAPSAPAPNADPAGIIVPTPKADPVVTAIASAAVDQQANARVRVIVHGSDALAALRSSAPTSSSASN